MKKWTVLSSQYVVENAPYIRTRRDHCRLPSGMEIDSYIQEYTDWVNAVVLTEKDEIVLVKQYRHGIGEFLLEIPGGMMEPGEDPREAIVREVAEETGYRSLESPILLGEFYPNPATSNNRSRTYLFQRAVCTEEQHLDSTEELEVHLIPFHEFGAMIRSGEVPQIFSVTAYFLTKDFLHR
ncbi:MAG: NUDIX hydrolase [Alicyclobacillaceae bacterium]|jgi:8-oxo-dGTP pyrophosphatase MutT (NUDIX family)|nr:NUDIX hydrolase [Alicyclobacillaceae bacterium]